ncbi:transposase [Pelagibaculum spongiae]|nr:transposase [Pelagibaculum spongiae]
MPSYSEERKHAVLKRLLPPQSLSIAVLAKEEGISEAALYNWRKRFNLSGHPVPEKHLSSEQWSAEAKLAVVLETARFNEADLSEYCREKGLYPDQIKQWKQACVHGNQSVVKASKTPRKTLKEKENENKIKSKS